MKMKRTLKLFEFKERYVICKDKTIVSILIGSVIFFYFMALCFLVSLYVQKNATAKEQIQDESTEAEIRTADIDKKFPNAFPLADRTNCVDNPDYADYPDEKAKSYSQSSKPVAEQYYNYRSGLDKIYSYDAVTDIPPNLPADCAIIRFPVNTVVTNYRATLRKFSFLDAGYRFALTIPEIDQLSDLMEKQNFRTIGVFCEDLARDSVKLSCFVYNPEESPFITINLASGQPQGAYSYMDVSVCQIGLSGNTVNKDNLYQSRGVSQSNYDSYGGTNSGNDDYYFSPYLVLAGPKLDDWCEPINWSIRSIDEYQEFWAKNRSDIMFLRSCFNDDRTAFDIEAYAKSSDVKINFAKNAITLLRESSDELSIRREIDDDKESVRIYLNNNRISYSFSFGFSPRVNGIPEEIRLTNDMEITKEQLNMILKFIQDVKVPS